MKVLITGASGMIGGEALLQCLASPKISQVVAFVRRDLPAEVTKDPKLTCVTIEDFYKWPQDTLRQHADASGMIWAMGSYNGNRAVDLDYPVAFIKAMGETLEAGPTRPKFRFVVLGGKFVRSNQEEKLWWGEVPRKIKGLLETESLTFADRHPDIWATYIIKPGGVTPKTLFGGGILGLITSCAAVFGENWSVRVTEVGAVLVYLATDGEEKESILLNAEIVRKGREVLGEYFHI